MQKNRWLALALLATAEFVVVLDLTIVNVALPHIQADLGFSANGLQWVISGYTLMFGGFLLLGGRGADLLGRRTMFMAGAALFTAASLAAGLSSSPAMMIVARAVQGLGAALLSPASLALLMVTFARGQGRNIAMGIWGALAGLGGTFGIVLGGLLIDAIGWRSVFFVNVPFGAAVILAAPFLLTESRVGVAGQRRFDVTGALLGTGGLLLLVFALVRTQLNGWGSLEVIGSLLGGVALLAAFIFAEARASEPLVPLWLFRTRGLRTATLALALNGGAFLAMFYMIAIFLQQVRGQSALETGLQLLPMGVAAVIAAILVSSLVTRVGTRPVQIVGALLNVIGLGLLSRADAGSPYVTSLLPGLLVFGCGILAIGVPAQIAAIAEVGSQEAGAASGIVTAGYEVGGVLGLAIVTTIANSRVSHLVVTGLPVHQALTQGYQLGLVVAAALEAINLVVAVVSPRIVPDAELVASAALSA
jgi:EmrB/QacA subfamily drug resistance transporter